MPKRTSRGKPEGKAKGNVAKAKTNGQREDGRERQNQRPNRTSWVTGRRRNVSKKAKDKGQENAIGNAKTEKQENTAGKGQRHGECTKSKTSNIRGNTKCINELWKPYLVSH